MSPTQKSNVKVLFRGFCDAALHLFFSIIFFYLKVLTDQYKTVLIK